MAKAHIIESLNDLPADASFPNGKVAIDTETLGLNTLRDRLCVCQLSDGQGNVWLVRFDGKDYSAPNLKKLLANPAITKIFHYARFDMAALYHYISVMPQPVYCTKIVSKLTRTYTDRHGLKTLAAEVAGVLMDKTEQSSDWAQAPLTDAQKHYAAGDVLHLHTIQKELDAKLDDRNRRHLAEACFAFLPTRVELDLAGWPETDIFSH